MHWLSADLRDCMITPIIQSRKRACFDNVVNVIRNTMKCHNLVTKKEPKKKLAVNVTKMALDSHNIFSVSPRNALMESMFIYTYIKKRVDILWC